MKSNPSLNSALILYHENHLDYSNLYKIIHPYILNSYEILQIQKPPKKNIEANIIYNNFKLEFFKFNIKPLKYITFICLGLFLLLFTTFIVLIIILFV